MEGFSVHPYHLTAYIMPLTVDKENLKKKFFFLNFKLCKRQIKNVCASLHEFVQIPITKTEA